MPINNAAERLQPNKSEQISNKMFELAEKVDGLKGPKLYEVFNKAGTEFATGNYDKGQRLLESHGFWDDNIRGVASEANQASREQVKAAAFGFNEAKAAVNSYAKTLESLGTRKDVSGAMQIESLIRGMDRPGQAGIDGVDEVLKYVEGTLQSMNHLERRMNTSEGKRQWEERRAVRDALLAEKNKRIEQMKQARQAGERLTGDRSSAGRALENLYSTAGIPEDTPSRQDLVRRVGQMSAEELHFFNAELNKAAGKYNMTGDKKTLDSALFDLASKKFNKTAVKAENKSRDERELERIRAQINGKETQAKVKNPEGVGAGAPQRPEVRQTQKVETAVNRGESTKKETETEKIPNDRRGLFTYHKENFGGIENLKLQDFKEKFIPVVEKKYQLWLKTYLENNFKDLPAGATRPDTVAGILGETNVGMLQRIIAAKEGRIPDWEEVGRMKFSDAAKKYYGIELPKDYFDHVSRR